MPEFTESSAADTAVDSTSTDTSTVEFSTATDTAPIDAAPGAPEGDALDALPNTPEPPAYASFNPEVLPEDARPAYTALHSDFEAANQFKAQAEPIVSWVNEIGGREAIEQDLQLLGKAFSPDPGVRDEFYDALYAQSPTAFQAIVGDIVNTAYGRQQVLELLGLNPALIETYRQIGADGTINGQPLGSEPIAEPEFLSELQPELRNLFRSFPREVQEDYALRSPVVAKFDLENAYRVHQDNQRITQERQAQEQRAAQERQQRVAQAQQQTYQQTRQIVTDSLKQAFDGDAVLPEIIASAVETEYFDSPEGQAQWMRLADLIAKGESRAVKAELPLVIAQVKAIAAKKSEHLAQIYADARKYRALQQKENPRAEIGGGDPAGTTRSTERPNGAGQYRPENILRYWEQGARG